MIRQILPEEVQKDLESGTKLHIIDVREDHEVAKGMIPGAKHIPLGHIEDRLPELDPEKDYILVCHAGGRSTKACEFLDSKGFSVKNLVGGMTAWEAKYSHS